LASSAEAISAQLAEGGLMPIELPELPPRIARLPRDERGYPVPAFVEWMRDGKAAARGEPGVHPDFRFVRPGFRAGAFKLGLCWICGDRLSARSNRT
jgi:hypothetical protein